MVAPSSTPFRADDYSTDWIDTQAALDEFCAAAGVIVGFDTEFVRTRTFFPRAGLYQVSAGDRVGLIDPLADLDFRPLCDLLSDPGIVKIMHACTEDLELLGHDLNVEPRGIFDTQLAYAFVSSVFSASYARLVEALLDIAVSKHETRSNWRQRPLTDEQIRYAALDVVHLAPMYEVLTRQLGDLGRVQWFEEDMVARGTYDPVAPGEYYRGVRKAWRLDPEQLGRFQALCTWREQRARHQDVPRNRVVTDDQLMEMAVQRRLSQAVVRGVVPGKLGARYAGELIEAFDRAAPVDAPLDVPFTQREGAALKRLREFAGERALALDIAVELLARKKDVEALMRELLSTGDVTPAFSGWRGAVLGEEFMQMLNEEIDALR